MTDKNETGLSPDIKFQLVKKIECHKVIGLAGHTMLEHEAKYLEFHNLSGVILFERNIESLPQVGELLATVDEKLGGDGLVPLVLADHEGDFVSELRKLIGIPPSAMAIAAAGDPQLASDVAYETGQAMRKLGVNVVLAPVADCYFDPASPVTGLRTFGKDPERVAEFVAETIRGFQKAGILTCAKHYPGHGATAADSHERLAEIEKSLDELRQSDLVPFARAVTAGVDMVMTAHIAFALGEETDEHAPASFDPRLIRRVLRDELGFEGVVITDALEMEGARQHTRTKYGGLGGGFERSILTGSDLLLYASPVPERITTQDGAEPMIAVEVMQTIIETLHKVVDRSRIERKLEDAAKTHEGIRNLLDILNQSEARITRLRELATERRVMPIPRSEGKVINLQDYASVPAIYKTVAERSLVLVRDPDRFIPVDQNTEWYLLPIEYNPGAFLKRQALSVFTDGLCRIFAKWKTGRTVMGFETDSAGLVTPQFVHEQNEFDLPAPGNGRKPVPVPSDAAVLPVLSARGTPPEEFLHQLAEFLEQRQVPLVLVPGWPVIDWIPESVGCLLTFGASTSVAAAAAAVLAGQAEAQGQLGHLL